MKTKIRKRYRWVALSVFAVIVFSCDSKRSIPSSEEPLFTMTSFTRPELRLDLLFVVDNSFSMMERQEFIRHQIAEVASEVVIPSEPGYPEIERLRIAMISSDFYALTSAQYPRCSHIFGTGDCGEQGCAWLDYEEGETNFSEFIGCIPEIYTTGSEFEQPLEASLRALTTLSEPGMPFHGFVREESLLGIIYISDEDDCSAPSEFDPRVENPEMLCVNNESFLYPVSRYTEAFSNLRRENDQGVFVVAHVGIPVDGSWYVGDSIEELRKLRQEQQTDPARPPNACNLVDMSAQYGIRFAELVYSFENLGMLTSYCYEDWMDIHQFIQRHSIRREPAQCFDREPFDSLDSCRLTQILGDDSECPGLADSLDITRTTGWSMDRGVEGGRRHCQILPVDLDEDGCPDGSADCLNRDYSGAPDGWFWDVHSENCEHGNLRFTNEQITDGHYEFLLECF